MLILVKGAGDLATGTAVRLYRAGFQVVMTDIAQPTAVRRTVAFSQCIYDGQTTVEGITARKAENRDQARDILAVGEIPVLVDPQAAILAQLPFMVVVDAILAKKNLGTTISDAPIVLALGPGFTAGTDCHGVIETKRGHDLGRLILEGTAIPNTGVPGDVGGYTKERIIRAPADGPFEPVAQIGQQVNLGDVVAKVNGIPVTAQLTGIVRGMLPAGIPVTAGMKAGDIDPRCEVRHCFTVSDKARAIGGGVLEGILYFGRRLRLWNDRFCAATATFPWSWPMWPSGWSLRWSSLTTGRSLPTLTASPWPIRCCVCPLTRPSTSWAAGTATISPFLPGATPLTRTAWHRCCGGSTPMWA